MKNNTFAIEFRKGLLKDYEKEILMSNKVKFLLPMGFVEKEETDRAIYDCGDFEPLYKLEGPLGVKSVLDILEKVVVNIILAEDYLLDGKRIALSCSTVYINRDTGALKLTYVPAQDNERSICGNIMDFAEELSLKYVSGIAVEYLAVVKSYAGTNISLSNLINKIGSMRREAFICGIQ